MSTPPTSNRILSSRLLSSSPPQRQPLNPQRLNVSPSPTLSPSAMPSTPLARRLDSPSEAPEDDAGDDEAGGAELPLTMAASVVLTSLPVDAKHALREASGEGRGSRKVTLRLRPLGSSPNLKQSTFKLSSTAAFATVIRFLRKKLGLQQHQSLCCYVGQSFSPGLDEEVGGLWDCFKTGEELVVQYSLTPVFG